MKRKYRRRSRYRADGVDASVAADLNLIETSVQGAGRAIRRGNTRLAEEHFNTALEAMTRALPFLIEHVEMPDLPARLQGRLARLKQVMAKDAAHGIPHRPPRRRARRGRFRATRGSYYLDRR